MTKVIGKAVVTIGSEAWLDERAAFEAKIERQKAAGVSHDTLYQRLRKLGWSEDRARFTPVRRVG